MKHSSVIDESINTSKDSLIESGKPLTQQQWFLHTALFDQQLAHAQIIQRKKLSRLRSSILKIYHAKPSVDHQKLDKLCSDWLTLYIGSCETVLSRHAALPVITYPEQLPVSEMRGAIKALIEKNPVVIVAGETGSGKTTQLPKMCLELGFGRHGLIKVASLLISGKVF